MEIIYIYIYSEKERKWLKRFVSSTANEQVDTFSSKRKKSIKKRKKKERKEKRKKRKKKEKKKEEKDTFVFNTAYLA